MNHNYSAVAINPFPPRPMEAESIRKPAVVYREPSGEEAVDSPVYPTAKPVGSCLP